MRKEKRKIVCFRNFHYSSLHHPFSSLFITLHSSSLIIFITPHLFIAPSIHPSIHQSLHPPYFTPHSYSSSAFSPITALPLHHFPSLWLRSPFYATQKFIVIFADSEGEAREDQEDEEREGEGEGEAEGGEEAEPEEPVDTKKLDELSIAEGLSVLAKTADGLGHAYVRLEIKSKEITDITALENKFLHLRYLDFSENKIPNLGSLGALQFLLSVNFSNNLVKTFEGFTKKPYLQILNMENNKLTQLSALEHPMLKTLNLNHNQIKTIETLAKLPNLEILELRANRLENTTNIDTPSLRELYLAENQITSLEGLQGLDLLHTLHLRGNKISSLDGLQHLTSLKSLNLRDNQISAYSELAKLKELKNLKSIVLAGNPISENDEYRMEVLMELPQLDKLDKDQFVQEDRDEAKELLAERMAEEAARKEAEAEAERIRKEQEAAQQAAPEQAEENENEELDEGKDEDEGDEENEEDED